MKEAKLQNNWPVIGHRAIVNFLQTSIKNNKLAHAYLFLGPDHIGRRVVAENFVYGLFCRDQDKKPCRSCSGCRQIARGIHPDLFFLTKDEDKKNISIEQVRKLQSKLSLGSFLNGYKIAIIDGVESLNIEAANALLKTLEEPAKETILILISNSLENLPETVVSRCQVLRFLPVAEEEIVHHLQKRGLNRGQAEDFAHLSFGIPGIAINFLENKELFEEYKKVVNEFLAFSRKDIAERFSFINGLASKKNDTGEMAAKLIDRLDVWTKALRDLLLIKNGVGEFAINRFILAKLEEAAGNYSVEKLLWLLKDISKTKKYLRQNVNAKLALENFVINL